MFVTKDVLFCIIFLVPFGQSSGILNLDLTKCALKSIMGLGVRFGYCTTNQASLAELVAGADATLFDNILRIKQLLCFINCCQWNVIE